jgi:hypothetical protein
MRCHLSLQFSSFQPMDFRTHADSVRSADPNYSLFAACDLSRFRFPSTKSFGIHISSLASLLIMAFEPIFYHAMPTAFQLRSTLRFRLALTLSACGFETFSFVEAADVVLQRIASMVFVSHRFRAAALGHIGCHSLSLPLSPSPSCRTRIASPAFSNRFRRLCTLSSEGFFDSLRLSHTLLLACYLASCGYVSHRDAGSFVALLHSRYLSTCNFWRGSNFDFRLKLSDSLRFR